MTLTSILSIAAHKVGISASLLTSVCMVESGLRSVNNFTDNYHSSHGICQIQLPSAREIIPYVDALALQQHSVNSYIAARILKRKIRKYGLELGIASYNSGSPKYTKSGVLINQAYVQNVLDLIEK